uniref:Uncharacterized protein n=1 Tax=Glossina austeni TaxID=7395 RepID=A0A1A9UNC2_GLOAU
MESSLRNYGISKQARNPKSMVTCYQNCSAPYGPLLEFESGHLYIYTYVCLQNIYFFFTTILIVTVLCITLHRTGLNEDYSTYSIVLMVIYFLQIREAVPSVEFLQRRIDFNKAVSIGHD